MQRSKTVDDYLQNNIYWPDELARLRKILQQTGLTEEVKWGMPCYTSNGKNVVSMVGFKAYFGLWFHQGAALDDNEQVLVNAQEGKTKALRQWRMNSAKDIRSNVVKQYVKEATNLID